jgi:hypothetical protein
MMPMTHVPAALAAFARRARTGGFQIQFSHQNLDHFIDEMDRSSNRLSFAIVIAAVVVGSALLIRVGAGPPVFGYSSLGLAGFLAAGILASGSRWGFSDPDGCSGCRRYRRHSARIDARSMVGAMRQI